MQSNLWTKIRGNKFIMVILNYNKDLRHFSISADSFGPRFEFKQFVVHGNK